MLRNGIYVLIALFLTIGCEDDDNPVTPSTPKYNIQITNLPESITSPEGVSQEVIFQVTVINSKTNEVVSGARVNFAVPNGGGAIFPVSTTTDANGIVEAEYSIDMPSGKSTATIFITADDQSYIANIDLIGTKRPANLYITPGDTAIFVRRRGPNPEFKLTVAVSDEMGMGIAGTEVLFEIRPLNPENGDSLFGSLTPIVETDQNGVAVTTFNTLGGSGRLLISCRVNEGEEFEQIKSEAIVSVYYSMHDGGPRFFLNSSTNYIYADNGVSHAIVRAVLKDEDNQAVEGASIVFTSNNNGTINSPLITDSLGIVRAAFSDIGIPSYDALGERAPCTITATCLEYRVEQSLEIDIRPMEAVDNIVLAAGKSSMRAGSGDTTWVRATCFLNPERTQVAPQGTWVWFEINEGMGSFHRSHVNVGDNGIAESIYIGGNQIGQATLQARVVNYDGGEQEEIYSNEVYIDLVPGPPASMSVSVTPTVLRVGVEGELATVIVTVTDSFGNPVRNGSVLVQFSATLGAIEPPIAVVDSGRVVAILTPGVEAGVSIITITIQIPDREDLTAQTAVSFIAGGGASIELSAHPLHIQVAGTGGVSTSTLRAIVRDANGNLVEVPTRVIFDLITHDEPPEAGNINGTYDSDTVLTSNGVAVATLNAGSKTGPQLIRAYTLDAEGNPTGVQATLSTVMVGSGPPEAINVDVNGEGIDAGGGAWTIEVAALVHDAYRNAVPDSIPIVFAILEENIGIISSGFTGNSGINGRPTPGVAYATLTYNSNNTFRPVTIRAYCRTLQVDSVGGDLEYILPLQRGQLSLHADPDNWMFDRDEPDEMCDIRVWAILRDGHGVLINNAPILFGSNRGRYWYDTRAGDDVDFEQFAPNPVRRQTGPLNDGRTPNERQNDEDERGHAVVWLRGVMDDFFLDPFTLEVVVQLQAQVEGYDDVFSDPEFVSVTRH